MSGHDNEAIRGKVREMYRSVVSAQDAGCGCSTSCCSKQTPTAKEQSAKLGTPLPNWTTPLMEPIWVSGVAILRP